MDGKISDDEIPDFALISTRLDEISTASDVLRLWIEKTIQVNKLNGTLFYEEVDKLKKVMHTHIKCKHHFFMFLHNYIIKLF